MKNSVAEFQITSGNGDASLLCFNLDTQTKLQGPYKQASATDPATNPAIDPSYSSH